MGTLFDAERREIADGAVHVPGWLDTQEQRRLVEACREWAQGPAGMRATRLPSGGVMSVRTVCLGWHWSSRARARSRPPTSATAAGGGETERDRMRHERWRPYTYTKHADDGTPVKPFPDWLGVLGRRAVTTAYDDPAAGEAYRPDIALVNFYDAAAKMGLHQDKDERSLAPVVSLSLGDTCVFRFGNTQNRNKPWTDVQLESGDLFVFGGPSRLAYHGVPKTLPGTGPAEIGLAEGRLNITLRQSGLPER